MIATWIIPSWFWYTHCSSNLINDQHCNNVILPFIAHWTLITAHYSANWSLHTAQVYLHTTHCTLHTEHSTLQTEECTLHTTHCKLHTASSTLYTSHCTLQNAHYIMYTVLVKLPITKQVIQFSLTTSCLHLFCFSIITLWILSFPLPVSIQHTSHCTQHTIKTYSLHYTHSTLIYTQHTPYCTVLHITHIIHITYVTPETGNWIVHTHICMAAADSVVVLLELS